MRHAGKVIDCALLAGVVGFTGYFVAVIARAFA